MTGSAIQRICLRIRYELDGESVDGVQELEGIFTPPDRFLSTSSSFLFDDYRLLYGDEAVVTPLASGEYELVGVVYPSKMRHFESDGGSGSFPTAELHAVGGEWEYELMYWLTHIPADRFGDFCAKTGRSFPKESEVFSGMNDIPC